jgi:hypothetical protein
MRSLSPFLPPFRFIQTALDRLNARSQIEHFHPLRHEPKNLRRRARLNVLARSVKKLMFTSSGAIN